MLLVLLVLRQVLLWRQSQLAHVQQSQRLLLARRTVVVVVVMVQVPVTTVVIRVVMIGQRRMRARLHVVLCVVRCHHMLLVLQTVVLLRTGSVQALLSRTLYRPHRLLLIVLEALLTTQVAPVLEHVARLRVQCPERALPRLVRRPWHLHEAVVEAERVSDGVLPPLLVLSVEREQIHNELVDLGQGEHLVRIILDGHRDQADVAVGWFGVRVTPSIRSGFLYARPLQQGRVR